MKSLLGTFVLCMMLIPSISFSGIRDVGNGGDIVVLEFTTTAKQLARVIKIKGLDLFPEFTAAQLEDAIAKTKVVSKEKTILNGVEKDAINYPLKKVIEVSRSRWMGKSISPEKLRTIVLHEYLGIMKINDADYSVSGRLVNYYESLKTKIAPSELTGRTYLTDQENPETQGLILLEGGKINFEGIVEGQNFKCTGAYLFSEDQQVLKADVKCGKESAFIEISYLDTDLINFLRNRLVDVELTFYKKGSDRTKSIFLKKTIDAKKLKQ